MANKGFGDIVNMPLPTERGPNIVGLNLKAPVPAVGAHYAGVFVEGYTFTLPNEDDVMEGFHQHSPVQARVLTEPAPGTPVFDWGRTPVLPDRVLPPALKRVSPLYRDRRWIPTRWDAAMLREAGMWSWIGEHGGLQTCCRIPELGAPIWSQPPWQVMPSQGREYKKMFSLPSAQISGGGPFTGADTVLGQFRIDIGYDGVISRFVANFEGNGFDNFSGNIVWRVKIGQRYAKNLGNVTNTFGSFQNALLVPGYGIRVISGQTITLIASIPVNSPVAGVVSAGIFGWIYPRR